MKGSSAKTAKNCVWFQTDTAVADLEKEIAGLEGLMKDLNDITSNEHKI